MALTTREAYNSSSVEVLNSIYKNKLEVLASHGVHGTFPTEVPKDKSELIDELIKMDKAMAPLRGR